MVELEVDQDGEEKEEEVTRGAELGRFTAACAVSLAVCAVLLAVCASANTTAALVEGIFAFFSLLLFLVVAAVSHAVASIVVTSTMFLVF